MTACNWERRAFAKTSSRWVAIRTFNISTAILVMSCGLRVDSAEDVVAVTTQLRRCGIEASEAQRYPEYAPDYWATYFTDPDGIRLEVTNYRQERRERHDSW